MTPEKAEEIRALKANAGARDLAREDVEATLFGGNNGGDARRRRPSVIETPALVGRRRPRAVLTKCARANRKVREWHLAHRRTKTIRRTRVIRKHETEVPVTSIAPEGFRGMTARFALTKDDGCPRYAMRILEFEPGGHTSLHAHAEEHEFYFLEGEPCCVDGEGRETRLGVGDFLYVAPFEPHQIRNAGSTRMRMICTIPILPGGDGKATVQAKHAPGERLDTRGKR